jgi:hypothetical protein
VFSESKIISQSKNYKQYLSTFCKLIVDKFDKLLFDLQKSIIHLPYQNTENETNKSNNNTKILYGYGHNRNVRAISRGYLKHASANLMESL